MRCVLARLFQSTLPARGATGAGRNGRTEQQDFNPRSPHGERRTICPRANCKIAFQSTLPARGATIRLLPIQDFKYNFNPRSPHGERHSEAVQAGEEKQYFNPRSPHGERPVQASHLKTVTAISIHAPRTGSDSQFRPGLLLAQKISIHAPRTGSDSDDETANTKIVRFQSTLPARGATTARPTFVSCSCISIHAPRTGSDTIQRHMIAWRWIFQSTLPARGATYYPAPYDCMALDISIHAPRTGSDNRIFARKPDGAISIHAPRTGSDVAFPAFADCQQLFQSTLPARGATAVSKSDKRELIISIHAPRTGSDGTFAADFFVESNFNPRSPHGERRISDLSKGGDE